jgi:hypothetical protein
VPAFEQGFTAPNFLDKAIRSSYEQTDKLTTYNVAAAWRQTQAAPLQVAQIGVATVSGFITTTNVQGGVRHELTARDTLNWQNIYTDTTFSQASTGIPFTDFLSTGDWTYRLNEQTALIPMVQLEELSYQGAAKTDISIWRVMAGLRHDVTESLRFTLSAGALFASAQATASNVVSSGSVFVPSIFEPAGTVFLPTGALQPILSPATNGQATSASTSDWLANLVVTYNFDPTTTLVVTAAQTVAPDSFGNVFKTDSAGFLLSRQVNYSERLSLAGTASFFTGAANSHFEFYQLAATYGYRLTRDVDTALTYTFRQRYSEPGGSANSHGVFVLVRRDFTIIP